MGGISGMGFAAPAAGATDDEPEGTGLVDGVLLPQAASVSVAAAAAATVYEPLMGAK